jgi:hypothetical protein
MLAGHHPYQADDARALLMMQATQPLPPLARTRPDLTAWPGLLGAIERACAKDPAIRHPTATDLRLELEAVFPQPGLAHPPEPRPQTITIGPPAGQEAISVTIAVTAAVAPVETRPRRRLRLRRRHALVPLALVAVALAVLGGKELSRRMEERPVELARALLASGEPEEARKVIAGALLTRPDSVRLRLLDARALRRMPGRAAAALDAYRLVADLDRSALEPPDLGTIASWLEDAALAEAAEGLLARTGDTALPALAAVARGGTPAARLRALDLARRSSYQGVIDPVAEYARLLLEEDCDVRRAAVRGLAELATPEAATPLRELARQTRTVRGLFGFPQKVPACGAVEADAAARSITRTGG